MRPEKIDEFKRQVLYGFQEGARSRGGSQDERNRSLKTPKATRPCRSSGIPEVGVRIGTGWFSGFGEKQ
jgi:hypothetical protein